MPHDARTVRADRESECHLPATRHAAREQQIGDVEADDTQQQHDTEHERYEWRAECVANDREPSRSRCEHERESAAVSDLRELVGGGVRENARPDDWRRLRTRLLERLARLQSADEEQPHHASVSQDRRIRIEAVAHRDREPDVR